MLVEFNVANFRSFHARTTFSMLAASALDAGGDAKPENVVTPDAGPALLKTAIVYGANASGKSNLVRALSFAKQLILNSSKETQAGEPIRVEPFRLSTGAEKEPGTFEFVWLQGAERFRYGFSVDAERIRHEWLFVVSSGDAEETELFHRQDQNIVIGNAFSEGAGLEARTRPNALFLSVVAQLNGPAAGAIVRWFSESLRIISGLSDRNYINFTARALLNPEWREPIVALAKRADLNISRISAEELQSSREEPGEEPPEDPPVADRKRSDVRIRVHHPSYAKDGTPLGEVAFELAQESHGTQKFIAFAGPLLDTLASGWTLIVDEFEARLHSRLSRAILETFHSYANANGAQLIATTHDTSLLDRRIFRRDQVWFAEKDSRGATALFSLAEYDVPADASYEVDYLQGRYGAVPRIDQLGFDSLRSRMQVAIGNAARLLASYDPHSPERDNPSTTVHLLVEALVRQES